MSTTPAKPVLVANEEAPQRPSREQALEAVRTLMDRDPKNELPKGYEK